MVTDEAMKHEQQAKIKLLEREREKIKRVTRKQEVKEKEISYKKEQQEHIFFFIIKTIVLVSVA